MKNDYDKDLRDCAERACRLAGNPGRFVHFHPAFPEHSVRLDPLRNFNRSSEVASRIASVIPGEGGSDPFKAFGQKSLDNIVQGLFALEQRPTLVKLRRYLEGGSATLVVRALERYFDRVLEDGWKNRLSSKAKDSEGRAMALVRHYRDTGRRAYPSDLGQRLSVHASVFYDAVVVAFPAVGYDAVGFGRAGTAQSQAVELRLLKPSGAPV